MWNILVFGVAAAKNYAGAKYIFCGRTTSLIVFSQEIQHQSLDGFDQNFFMTLNTTLNTLQANQIDDLENVLLPHLTLDRADSIPPNGRYN